MNTCALVGLCMTEREGGRASYPLKLELQEVVSIGAGT